MSARLTSLGAVLIVVAVTAVVVGIDLVRPANPAGDAEPVIAGRAVAGAWYCVAGNTSEGSTATYYAAAPRSENGESSEVFVNYFRAGTVTEQQSARIFPFTSSKFAAPPDLATIDVGVRWFTVPAAVSRSWRVRGPGVVEGLVEGPCAPGPSTTWYIAGMTTSGGAQAAVHLTNPFATDASVAIRFTTPSGEIAPVLLENVLVEGRSSTVVPLNEHAPQQSDLGIEVTARSGRVVAEGVQSVSAAIGDIDSVSLVRAVPRLSETWTIPFTVTDPIADEPDTEASEPPGDEASEPETEPTDEPSEATSTEPEAPATSTGTTDVASANSWVWISNPTDEPAALSLTLHGPDGVELPDMGEELQVPAAGQLRVDLAGLLPAGQREVGVTVRSENGVPVAASAATVVRDGDGRTGMSIQRGDSEPDTVYVMSGEARADRRQFIDLVNPGAETAVLDVSLFNGITALRPAELQGLEVPAGSMRSFELGPALEGSEEVTAVISVRQGSVVAGRHAFSRTDRMDWVVHGGISAGLWRGGAVVPAVRRDPELTRSLGTR